METTTLPWRWSSPWPPWPSAAPAASPQSAWLVPRAPAMPWPRRRSPGCCRWLPGTHIFWNTWDIYGFFGRWHTSIYIYTQIWIPKWWFTESEVRYFVGGWRFDIWLFYIARHIEIELHLTNEHENSTNKYDVHLYIEYRLSASLGGTKRVDKRLPQVHFFGKLQNMLENMIDECFVI